MREFVSYYVRSALPFLTGLAFGIGASYLDLPLAVRILAGAVLVVAGPLAIEVVLTLLVEALRGPGAAQTRGIGALGAATRQAAMMRSRGGTRVDGHPTRDR